MMKLIRWMISGGVLPEKPRLVLQSIVWQEKPYKQVAAEMGISVNTVTTTPAPSKPSANPSAQIPYCSWCG